jgi:hypothetical protein
MAYFGHYPKVAAKVGDERGSTKNPRWDPKGPVGATSTSAEKSGRETGDGLGQLFIGLLQALSLGIIAQEGGRIVADALGNGVHRDSGVEQGSGMDAPQVVKPGATEPKLFSPAGKIP